MKYYEACNSSNEMNWNIMKHAVAVMKWIEKHEMKYELKWNEMKYYEACNSSNEMNWNIM